MAKNKRVGPDTIMNLISGISILSWVVLGVIFIILLVGNPTSSAYSAVRVGKAGGTWISSAIYALLVFLILLSITGVVFNLTRLKRKSDKIRLTPIISGILSIIGLIFLSMK